MIFDDGKKCSIKNRYFLIIEGESTNDAALLESPTAASVVLFRSSIFYQNF